MASIWSRIGEWVKAKVVEPIRRSLGRPSPPPRAPTFEKIVERVERAAEPKPSPPIPKPPSPPKPAPPKPAPPKPAPKKEKEKKEEFLPEPKRPPSELPPGFEPVGESGSIRQNIEDSLHFVKDMLPQYEISVNVFQNKDNSIDGELVMMGFTTWAQYRHASMEIEKWLKPIPGVYLAVGHTFPVGATDIETDAEKKYDRYMGDGIMMTYQQRSEKKAYRFVSARIFGKAMKTKGLRMPNRIIVRYAWIPGGGKPK